MKTLWCKNQENPRDRLSHAWAPLSTILSQVGHSQLIASSLLTDPTLIKKENKISLTYQEIQSRAVAKSYMRKGFLIYEEMRKFFPIYEEAVSHI
jgi:hypothetical protein